MRRIFYLATIIIAVCLNSACSIFSPSTRFPLVVETVAGKPFGLPVESVQPPVRRSHPDIPEPVLIQRLGTILTDRCRVGRVEPEVGEGISERIVSVEPATPSAVPYHATAILNQLADIRGRE